MNPSRQVERRDRFQSAIARMPDFETWTEQRWKLSDVEYFNACRDAGVVLDRKTVMRGNFRLIPRHMRRSMARALANREYRNAHGLV